MEVLREEDERTTASLATSPQQQQPSSSSTLAMTDSSRKNSSNFGVRTYIHTLQTPAAASSATAYRNVDDADNDDDDDNGLLLGQHERNLGRPVRHYRSSVQKSGNDDDARRRRNRWRPWAWVRQLVRNYVAPVIYGMLTLVRWQILLTVGCVTLCAGIVLVGIGLAFHDRQVLFPKDHEIQYLSVSDWRLNRRFHALRSIGAVLFGAGGGLALAALGISAVSRCKPQRASDDNDGEVDDDDGRTSSSGYMQNTTTTTERRFLLPASSYQPIEPNGGGGGNGQNTAAAPASLSFGLTATSSSSSKPGSRRGSSLAATLQPIPSAQHVLPDFPTGSVSVETVQLLSSGRAEQ